MGIFYGSSTGCTQQIALKIGARLNISKTDIHDIGRTPVDKLGEYNCLLLGSSTWGLGDIQDDWNLSKLESLDLHGKKVAVFGTGDSSSYSDTFCDAMALLARSAQKAGSVLVGNDVESSDYTFDSSSSEENGRLCGLAIDEDNESEKTDARIELWVSRLLIALEI